MALLLSACQGGSEPAAEPDGSPALAALARVPVEVDDSAPMVEFFDMERFTDQFRVLLPDDCSNDARRSRFISDIAAESQLWVALLARELRSDLSLELSEPGLATAFGFEVCDIVRTVSGGFSTTLYEVRTEVDRIDDAVRSDPNWSDLLTLDDHAGVSYYQWGDESVFERGQTIGRSIPVGGQLFVDAPYVLQTRRDEVMRDAIDAVAGENWAGLRGVPEIVSAFDTAETHSFVITGPPTYDFEYESFVALARYQLLGLGSSVVDGVGTLTVAMTHGSTALAEENAVRFRSIVEQGSPGEGSPAWSDLLRVESVQVDDTLVVATLTAVIEDPDRPRDPFRVALNSLYRGDTLFQLEG